MKRLRKAAALAAGLIATVVGLGPAAAQEYPQGPVTMVVAFAAGGPSDTVARVVGERTSRSLGNTATAFTPIGLVSDVPMVVLGRADLPPTSLPESLTYIKGQGEALTAGAAGVGSGAHLCAVPLSRAPGLKITTVSYKGTSPAMIDLLGGQIDMMCDQTTTAIGQIKGGKVKAYAVTGLERSEALPELPTLAEAGLSDVELSIWHGLYGPAGTQEPVVARLEELATEPAAPDEVTPAALRARLDAEIARWRTFLTAAR